MKDAIGGSLLLNLVVIFTSIIILFFAGIMAYSKAYKVKNKIIEIIEGYDGKIKSAAPGGEELEELKNEVALAISKELESVGYLISQAPSAEMCKNDSSRGTCAYNLNKDNFKYCICEQDSAIESGKSYEVITYVHFSFPIIGDLLTFPVKGETRVLGREYDY